MLIYLIGMPASGKTTIGRELAKCLKFKFLDLDERIEKLEGKKINKIFQSKGEEYFRMLESDVLAGTFEMKNTVVACGGGTPCFADNLDLMNAFGITVYLKVEMPQLLANLQKDESTIRPVLNKISLEELFLERKEIYESAQIQVDLTEENYLETLISELNQFK